ncbi:MAG TPA: hypothetical protein VN132_09255 [Bdellovibrio sp.]|nr:hypothetical protein [Bdellovibrio sp.]
MIKIFLAGLVIACSAQAFAMCDAHPGILAFVGEHQLAGLICSQGKAYYSDGSYAGMAGSKWFYSNGLFAGRKDDAQKNLEKWYHSNGMVAYSGGRWYHADGMFAGQVGGKWYYADGTYAGNLF